MIVAQQPQGAAVGLGDPQFDALAFDLYNSSRHPSAKHNYERNMAATKRILMSHQRSLVIYINEPNQIVKHTLLEFSGDLGNQEAGFDSDAELRANSGQRSGFFT